MSFALSKKENISKLTIRAQDINEWLQKVLVKAGLKSKDAAAVAENLVLAEARGVCSHGLILLGVYVARIREGGIRPNYQISIVSDAGSIVLLDGDAGPGQSLATFAVQLAVERAEKTGLSFVTLRNSNHVGMLATYGLNVAKAGMIGLIMTNSGPSVSVFHGLGSRIGNNALCVAIPDDPHPIVLDMATGTVACGKIRLAAGAGEPIPEHWIHDKYGKPSVNPTDLDEGGSVTPLGGHKGYGLGVIVDILTGLVSGGVSSLHVVKQRSSAAIPTRASQSFVVLDPEKLAGREYLMQQTHEYINDLRRSTPISQDVPVLAPGDPELFAGTRSGQTGITIPRNTLIELNKVASSLNLPGLQNSEH